MNRFKNDPGYSAVINQLFIPNVQAAKAFKMKQLDLEIKFICTYWRRINEYTEARTNSARVSSSYSSPSSQSILSIL